MRVVVAVVLCALIAFAVSLSWRGDVRPEAPNAGDAPAASDAAGPAAGRLDPGARGADATRERAAAPVAPPPPASDAPVVRGRLLQGGAPLVGATVRQGDGVAVSDASGRFVLPVAARGKAFLEVSGDGVPRGVSIGPLVMGRMRDRDVGDLLVPTSVAVVGRVVDVDGRALANVRVYAKHDKFVYGLAPDDPGADLNALSGQDGSFRIGGLRPGKVQVRAELEGHGSQRPDAVVMRGVGDVGVVVVTRYEDLAGVVVDDRDRPLAGARVTPGGGSSELQTWDAVETDEDGRFVLAGKGKGWEVTVERPGYARQTFHSVYALPRPLRLALRPASPLRGRVRGLDGAAATVFVDTPEGDYRPVPSHISRYDWVGLPVLADGTFEVPHLPDGAWVLRVRAPGRGSVAETAFSMPRADVLELELRRDRTLSLTFVDEVGAPVRDVDVVRVDAIVDDMALEQPTLLGARWLGWGRGEATTSDDAGEAVVSAPVFGDVCLAFRAPEGLATALVFREGKVPAQHVVELPRTGFVEGALDDAALCAFGKLTVFARRPEGEKGLGASERVDARGRFRLGPLLPGTYEIGVTVADLTAHAEYDMPVAAPTPIIHDYGPVTGLVAVEVRAAETVELTLPAPKLGEVRGRVLAGARPIAGAIVYAEEVKAEGEQDSLFGRARDGLDAHDYEPNCRTDELGRFRFLIASARTIRIRARRDTSGSWCAPIEQAVSPLSDLDLPDILLPASTIRGRFDLTTLDPKARASAEAQLYPIEKAAADPFYFADWVGSVEWDSQRVPIGVSGAFAFEGVQPGTWVLRVTTGFHQVGVLREVTLAGDDVVDLGQLTPDACVEPRVESGLEERFAVWLRRVSPVSAAGVHVATVGSFGRVGKLPAVPPGDYLLVPFEPGPYGMDTIGVSGRQAGDPIAITIGADGSVTPSIVWKNGL